MVVQTWVTSKHPSKPLQDPLGGPCNSYTALKTASQSRGSGTWCKPPYALGGRTSSTRGRSRKVFPESSFFNDDLKPALKKRVLTSHLGASNSSSCGARTSVATGGPFSDRRDCRASPTRGARISWRSFFWKRKRTPRRPGSGSHEERQRTSV